LFLTPVFYVALRKLSGSALARHDPKAHGNAANTGD
jgi:multidrug efflux pump